MTPVKERFTLRERSWIMYDWANSVYATNIMAAIFPTIFVSIAGDAGVYPPEGVRANLVDPTSLPEAVQRQRVRAWTGIKSGR